MSYAGMLDVNGVILTQFLPAFVNSDVRNPMITTLECDGYAIQDTSTPSALVQLKSNEGGIQFGIPGNPNTGCLASDGVDGLVYIENLTSGTPRGSILLGCATAPQSEVLITCKPSTSIPAGIQIVNTANGITEPGALRVAPGGDVQVDATQAGGNVAVLPAENKDLLITTDPATSGDSCGIEIARNDTPGQLAHIHLNNLGGLDIDTHQGFFTLSANQAPPSSAALQVSVNPFTGTCAIANVANNTLNGNIQLYSGPGPVSFVDVVAGGARVINQSDITKTTTISTSSSGVGQLTSTGNSFTVGDNSSGSGSVLSVNGSAGLGRVYDSVYNIPPVPFQNGIPLSTASTFITSFTSPVSFNINTTGLYMITAYINYNGVTVPSDPDGTIAVYLKYGDPAHAASPVSGTFNQIATSQMTSSASFGYIQIQTICNLSNNTYEPNQRYNFAVYVNPAFPASAGLISLAIYQLA
jgi:hypothetical protein